MKLQKTTIGELSRKKYLEYLSILPQIKQEKTQKYLTLIFTLAAVTFFSLFAINPTLVTIVDLKKQLADNSLALHQLEQKILNLGTLQQQYTTYTSSLPLVMAAIPKTPNVAYLLGQVQAASHNTNVHIISLQAFPVELSRIQKATNKQNHSFTFTVDASGSYDNLMQFSSLLARLDRILTFESISLKNEKGDANDIQLSIRARAYFQ